jgi:hypothetical protein
MLKKMEIEEDFRRSLHPKMTALGASDTAYHQHHTIPDPLQNPPKIFGVSDNQYLTAQKSAAKYPPLITYAL